MGDCLAGIHDWLQAVQIALKVLPALEGELYSPKSGIVNIVKNDACGVDAADFAIEYTLNTLLVESSNS